MAVSAISRLRSGIEAFDHVGEGGFHDAPLEFEGRGECFVGEPERKEGETVDLLWFWKGAVDAGHRAGHPLLDLGVLPQPDLFSLTVTCQSERLITVERDQSRQVQPTFT